MRGYFVTATGTDIGKTYIAAGIIRAAREAGRQFSAIKPVLSGYNPHSPGRSDPAILLEAMGKRATARNIAAISPWRFAEPLSPDMAAAREGKSVNFESLIKFCETALEAAQDRLLVEGVGGIAAPIDITHLVADWISRLNIAAILVAGTYLGTISHTVTAAEVLLSRRIRIAAIVLNESPAQPVTATETAETIARFLPEIPIHIIPRDLNDLSFRGLARSL